MPSPQPPAAPDALASTGPATRGRISAGPPPPMPSPPPPAAPNALASASPATRSRISAGPPLPPARPRPARRPGASRGSATPGRRPLGTTAHSAVGRLCLHCPGSRGPDAPAAHGPP
ncbi:basic proline-rich protein-like [Panicum virgatum]|uniref:basic proline-rich protein-like n=1 Tax=Panicum virgatum TaxID=38727 RepID=UPI0019D4FA27|nr:basic proline-rich protein-like [Panicum virgatum]